MANWKEMAPYHGISSVAADITKPNGTNYYDSNGNIINHAPDDIIEGDTQFTAASVPINKTEGMIDWRSNSLTIEGSSGGQWGRNMNINGMNAAQLEAADADITFGVGGNAPCFPIRTKASGNEVEQNDNWYNSVGGSSSTNPMQRFVDILESNVGYRIAGLDDFGDVNYFNFPIGLYIAKRNGTPNVEVPYPTLDSNFMMHGVFDGLDDFLVGGGMYDGFTSDNGQPGFEYLRNHTHDSYTYVSGEGTSSVVKSHLKKNVGTLSSGTDDAIVVDNDQYIDALFTDDNGKDWIIYDLAKGSGGYGDNIAPAAGSSFKTYMDADTGVNSISSTVGWNAGLSNAVSESNTDVPHIAEALTPVCFDSYLGEAWLPLTTVVTTHTEFKVDGQDGSAADSSFTTIAEGETFAGDSYVFMMGRFLFVNITDLKASNAGIDSSTSNADHATNMVWNITTLRGFKNVAHLGNLEVDHLAMHTQYMYLLDDGATDDLTLVSNQLNLINTTTGNVTGNGGLGDGGDPEGPLANRQSLVVPSTNYALSLNPGASASYDVNKLSLTNTDNAEDPDRENEIYLKWSHDAGNAGTPAEGMSSRSVISWGYADPGNYVANYDENQSEQMVLQALGKFIDQDSYGSLPDVFDVESFFGTDVMGTGVGDTANIDFGQWELHMNHMPENCIFTIGGNLYKAPGTDASQGISGDFSNNAKIFIRLADDDDDGYDDGGDVVDTSGS